MKLPTPGAGGAVRRHARHRARGHERRCRHLHKSVRTTPSVAELSVIQGLPQTSVDVYLNGTEIVQDFRYKGVVGPLPLAPGKYHVAIRLHGAARGTTPLLSGTGWLGQVRT